MHEVKNRYKSTNSNAPVFFTSHLQRISFTFSTKTHIVNCGVSFLRPRFIFPADVLMHASQADLEFAASCLYPRQDCRRPIPPYLERHFSTQAGQSLQARVSSWQRMRLFEIRGTGFGRACIPPLSRGRSRPLSNRDEVPAKPSETEVSSVWILPAEGVDCSAFASVSEVVSTLQANGGGDIMGRPIQCH